MGRIIAGTAKGTKIASPKGDATRPTSDRVKEGLFSALAAWFDTVDVAPDEHLSGVAVLDLYAGTGGLALEAASRGASTVVAVDQHTSRIIEDNARRTKLRIDVRRARVQQVVVDPGTPFDLVFVDPPYDVVAADVDLLVAQLAAAGGLAPQALVVVERSSRSPAPEWPAAFTRTWDRRYGESTLHFGATESESSPQTRSSPEQI